MRGIREFLWTIFIGAAMVCVLSCTLEESSPLLLSGRASDTVLSFPDANCDSTLKLIDFVAQHHVAFDPKNTVSLLRAAMQKIISKGQIPTPYFVENITNEKLVNNQPAPTFMIKYKNFTAPNILFDFLEMNQFCSAVQTLAQEISAPLDLLHKGIFRYFVASLDPHSSVLESLEQGYILGGFRGFLRRDQDENVTFFSPGHPYYALPKDDKGNGIDIMSNWVSSTSVLSIEIIEFKSRDGNSPSTAEKFRQLYQEALEEKQISALVIDVRRNTGGDSIVVNDLADLFLKQGTTVLMREKNGKSWVEYKRVAVPGNELPGIDKTPVIILVSRYSASAAETFSATMKENKGAIIVGERTFGKGTAQRTVILRFGGEEDSFNKSYLTLSMLYLFSPKGIPLQRNGVEPDIAVTDQDYLSQLRANDQNEFNRTSESKRWAHALPTPTTFALNDQFQEPNNSFLDQWKEKLKAYFERQEYQFRLNDLANAF